MSQFTLPSFVSGKSQGFSDNPYLACLIDPANNVSRYPDEYSNQTALYSSRSYYDVYGNSASGTAAPDIGKFSFYIRPVIGGVPANTTTAQVQCFNPGAVWPANGDFSNVGLFQSFVDPNLTTLIGPTNIDGLVREIRPVGMSAWFQFTAPTMTIGGYVASALTDGNYFNWINNYNTTPMAGLPLQEYRALSTLPNSFAGKLTEGTYSFYKPYDAEDVTFKNAHRPYQSQNDYGVAHNYPSIVVSGQVMATGATYTGPVGRIQVDIVFEYVTLSRVVQSIPSPVDIQMIWNARQALQNYRTCMANDDHPSFIKKVLGLAKQLLIGVAPVLGGTIGTMIAGPPGAAVGTAMGSAVKRRLNTTSSVPKPVPKKPKNSQAQKKQKMSKSKP